MRPTVRSLLFAALVVVLFVAAAVFVLSPRSCPRAVLVDSVEGAAALPKGPPLAEDVTLDAEQLGGGGCDGNHGTPAVRATHALGGLTIVHETDEGCLYGLCGSSDRLFVTDGCGAPIAMPRVIRSRDEVRHLELRRESADTFLVTYVERCEQSTCKETPHALRLRLAHHKETPSDGWSFALFAAAIFGFAALLSIWTRRRRWLCSVLLALSVVLLLLAVGGRTWTSRPRTMGTERS